MNLTLLDRYIGRTIIVSTLLVFAILLALFSFFIFVDALGDLGKAEFGLVELAKYVILSLPRKIYELFPTAALLGATVGLSTLAISSELVAMRSAGLSPARIIGSVIKTSMVFVVCCVLLGEFLVPISEDLAQRGRAEALHTGVQQKNTGLWLRDGPTFVNIGEVLPDRSLLRVQIYQLEQGLYLQSHTYAAAATYTADKWHLVDVERSLLQQNRIRTQQIDTDFWQTTIQPEVIGVFAVKPEGLSSWQLFRYLKHLMDNHQDTGRYELALWNKLLLPLATVVMVLLAVSFVFSPVRSGRMGSRIFIGIMLGLAFTLLQRGFGFFGLVYGVPPVIGAALPIAGFMLGALYLLRRVT